MTDKQAMFEELLNLFSFTQEQAERVMSEPVEITTVEQYVDLTEVFNDTSITEVLWRLNDELADY